MRLRRFVPRDGGQRRMTHRRRGDVSATRRDNGYRVMTSVLTAAETVATMCDKPHFVRGHPPTSPHKEAPRCVTWHRS